MSLFLYLVLGALAVVGILGLSQRAITRRGGRGPEESRSGVRQAVSLVERSFYDVELEPHTIIPDAELFSHFHLGFHLDGGFERFRWYALPWLIPNHVSTLCDLNIARPERQGREMSNAVDQVSPIG